MPLASQDVVRASVRFQDAAGNDHVNVYHFKATNAISDSDSTIMIEIRNLMSAAYSNMATNISNAVNELDIKFDVVEFVGGVLQVARNIGLISWSMSTAPSASNDPMPPGVAALVKLLTGVGKVYGRKFVGMFTEAAQANGILSSGFQTQLASYASDILGGVVGVLTGGDLQSGVMSEKFAAFVPFTAYDVSDTIAYQRRRRQGTGS